MGLLWGLVLIPWCQYLYARKGRQLAQRVGCRSAQPHSDKVALELLATDKTAWTGGYTYILIQSDISSTDARFPHHVEVGVPKQPSRGSSFFLRRVVRGGGELRRTWASVS